VLMATALVATVLLVPRTPRPAAPAPLSAPLKALRHRGLLTMGITALLYNWGFFTMLGYVPFPMHLSIYRLGAVFFGWGVLVAVFSVFVAPRLQRRFGTAPTLYVNLALFAAVLAVIAACTDYPGVLIVCVVVAGAMIGVNNTLTTQAVMLVAPVERPVASAAYGFIRFIGGGLAPFAAGKLADRFSLSVPFYLGAAAFILAIFVLATGHRLLADAEAGLVEPAEAEPAAPREPQLETLTAPQAQGGRAVVVAVGATPDAEAVVRAAAGIARRTGGPLEIVRVRETMVIEELAIDVEPADVARAALREHVAVAAGPCGPARRRQLHRDAGRPRPVHPRPRAPGVGARGVRRRRLAGRGLADPHRRGPEIGEGVSGGVGVGGIEGPAGGTTDPGPTGDGGTDGGDARDRRGLRQPAGEAAPDDAVMDELLADAQPAAGVEGGHPGAGPGAAG
jgi:MFS transporter